MVIKDLFDKSKPIDRKIEKVITYAASDSAQLRNEVTEYVATEKIEESFDKLLNLLDEGMQGGWDKEIGVWLSGFYGSGKSSFTKYLGFALDDQRQVEGKPFYDWLRDQFKSVALRQRLSTVVKRHPTVVFMLDLASAQLAGATMAEISTVLYYTVIQWAGYSRDQKIAYLQDKLERDGKIEAFKERIEQLAKGKSWASIQNDPLVLKTYASRLASEFYPELWPDSKAFNEVSVETLESEEERVKRMIDLIRRRSGRKNILFIIDEVGQYVAARNDLILNLDGLAKNVKSIGQGHVWLIATAQQTLTEDDPRAQVNTAGLFKLQARFPIPIDLEASDIKEICYRRLLAKSTEGEKRLQALFDSHGQSLRLHTNLANTRYFSSSNLDKKTFGELYPFLPQHFDILLELLGRLAKSIGGIGLRSAIKVIQDVLVDKSGIRPGAKLLADREVGTLVTSVDLYDTLRHDMQRSFRHVVEAVEKTEKVFGIDSMESKTARSLAILQTLEKFPVTRENLAALMHPAVSAPSLLPDVKAAVEEMLKEPSVPLSEVDGSLRFMSEAVTELEKEKQNILVRPADTRHIMSTKLKDIFTPLPTTQLNGTRAVSTGIKIATGASQVPIAGDKEVIQTLVETVTDAKYPDRLKEVVNESVQVTNKLNVFLLGKEDPVLDDLLVDAHRCEAIYKQHHNKAVEKEVRDYLNGQLQRSDTLKEDIKDRLLKCLSKGSLVFKGNSEAVKTLADECKEATKKFLANVASQVYEKYREAPVQVESAAAEKFLKFERLENIPSSDDPLTFVKKAGKSVSIDTGHKAIVSVKDYLDRHGQVDGRKLLDDFYAPPYGWSKDTTRYITAAMLIAGEIKLRVGGEDVTVRGDVAINNLKNTNAFNKIGISLRDTKPSPEALLRASDRLLQITGEQVLPIEDAISKNVIKHFPDLQQDYAPLHVQLKNLGLPGAERGQSVQEGISEILKGDASDAANRLGCEECPFYDSLLWAQEVRRAFDNKIEDTIKKANEYLKEIGRLPQTGVPGKLSETTAEDRAKLSEFLGKDDFYKYVVEMQQLSSSIEDKVKAAVRDLIEELEKVKEIEVRRLQSLPEWKLLGLEDRAWFQSEVDKIVIKASETLEGLKHLLNSHFTIVSEFKRLEQEIRERAKTAGGNGGAEPGVYEVNFTEFPVEIKGEKEIDDIIKKVADLKNKLREFPIIRIIWR